MKDGIPKVDDRDNPKGCFLQQSTLSWKATFKALTLGPKVKVFNFGK